MTAFKQQWQVFDIYRHYRMTTVTSLGYAVFAKSVLSFFFSQSYKFKSVIAVNRIQFATITIMYVEDIIAACRKVMDGDEEALQQLGLNNVSYPLPKPTDTSLDRLQINYTCALNITVVARELQFSLIEDQCKIAMRLMQTIAQDRNASSTQRGQPGHGRGHAGPDR